VTTTTAQQAETTTVSTDELQEQLRHSREELANYRKQVRDRAIRGFKEDFFKLDSLNETLTKLGLEPYTPRYISRIPVTLELTVQTNLGANDASRRFTSLNTTAFRDALQEAIVRVLAEHGGETFGTVPNTGIYIYAQRPDQIMEED
jgi:hypothetical protein